MWGKAIPFFTSMFSNRSSELPTFLGPVLFGQPNSSPTKQLKSWIYTEQDTYLTVLVHFEVENGKNRTKWLFKRIFVGTVLRKTRTWSVTRLLIEQPCLHNVCNTLEHSDQFNLVNVCIIVFVPQFSQAASVDEIKAWIRNMGEGWDRVNREYKTVLHSLEAMSAQLS